jgi:quercetin dioxygenase-like cupin family protein
MKKILLPVLLCFLLSCNQNNKPDGANTILTDPVSKNTAIQPGDIDALTASPANFKLLIENQYVRVLEYTLDPGEKDQWHTHPAKSSYVVSGGNLKVFLENGDSILSNETAGTALWMDHVGKHYVENTGSTRVKIILTEIKSLEKTK